VKFVLLFLIRNDFDVLILLVPNNEGIQSNHEIQLRKDFVGYICEKPML
jgi:hypothetical protein